MIVSRPDDGQTNKKNKTQMPMPLRFETTFGFEHEKSIQWSVYSAGMPPPTPPTGSIPPATATMN